MKNAKQHPTDITWEFEKSGITAEACQEAPSCEGLQQKVLAKIKVTSLAQCQEVVQICSKHSYPIYPFSTGKNWGFGTQSPSSTPCLLIDLSALNEISHYDEELGSIQIQCGTTQKELSTYLEKQNSTYRIDVTGSGEDTSVLGNTLERGVGYKALRHEALLSLTVLLMDGSLLKTGYARFPNSELNKCLSYGLGPSLNHLFTQSNFGIVIDATIRLQKKPEYSCCFSFSINNDEEFSSATQSLKELLEDGVLNCIPKMADRTRCEIVFCPKYMEKAKEKGLEATREKATQFFQRTWGDQQWNVFATLEGPRTIIESKKDYIRKKLSMHSLRFIDTESTLIHREDSFEIEIKKEFDRILLGYCQGKPSNESLKSTYWQVMDSNDNYCEPEKSNYAFLYMAPALPNTPKAIKNFFDVYKKHTKDKSLSPALTLNLITPYCLEAVISLSFRKNDPFEIKRNYDFKDALFNELFIKGILPYRLDTHSMSKKFLSKSVSSGTWEKVCHNLKSILDPKGLLSKNRYGID